MTVSVCGHVHVNFRLYVFVWPIFQSAHVFCIFFLSTLRCVQTLCWTCCCWRSKPAPGMKRCVWLTSPILSQSLGGELWSQAFQMDLGAGWVTAHSWPGFSHAPRPPPPPPLLASSHHSPDQDQDQGELCYSSCLEKCVFSLTGSFCPYFGFLFLTFNFGSFFLCVHPSSTYKHIIHCHLFVPCCLHLLVVIDVRQRFPWGLKSTICMLCMPHKTG